MQIRSSSGWSCPAATTIPPPREELLRARSRRPRGTRGRAPRAPRPGAGPRCRLDRPLRSRAEPACPASSSRRAARTSSPSPLRSRTSSSLSHAPRHGGTPASTPSRTAFSRPVSGAISARADREERRDRPSTSIVPRPRARTPAITRRSVVFPAPLRPSSAIASPGADREAHVAQAPGLGASRGEAGRGSA